MKYKHALFLNPYLENASTSIMGVFPPAGLEYVATGAKDFVEKLTLLDLRYEKDLSNPSKLADFIRREKIDIICASIRWDRQFEDVCTRLNLLPNNIPLVIGGYKATERVLELFAVCPNVQIIARGEAEEMIKEILGDAPLENILGISYRKDDRVIHNANKPLPDVNTIAIPDRSLRRHQYRMKMGDINVTSTTYDYLLSARGCPYDCKFCTFNINPLGQKRTYSARSIDSVIEELESIKAGTVFFSDDNFAVDPKKAEKLCDLIIERKIKKRFITQSRIEIANHPSLLDKMTKAGFKVLLLGLESPHDHILAQLNKGFDSNAIRKAFSALRKYPIFTHGYFIYGNIGEVEEEMMFIPKFAKEIGVDSIACSKLRVDKYSPLKKLAERTPGYHVTDRGECYSDMYSHPALKKIGRRMKYSFYTPLKMLKISWKLLTIRLFTFREIVSFLIAAPFLLKVVLVKDIQKKRLGDSLRRIFISNK